MKSIKNGISRFTIMLIRISMIKNLGNGLDTCIVMEPSRNLQKEIYLKGRFICHGRNGIAGSCWKRWPRITRLPDCVNQAGINTDFFAMNSTNFHEFFKPVNEVTNKQINSINHEKKLNHLFTFGIFLCENICA